MKRIFAFLILAAILIGGASATTVRITSYGTGLNPFTWHEGTTTISGAGNGGIYTLQKTPTDYYMGMTGSTGNTYQLQAKKSYETVTRYENGHPYRIAQYGDWEITNAQGNFLRKTGTGRSGATVRQSVANFNVQRTAQGKYAGTAYFGVPKTSSQPMRTSYYPTGSTPLVRSYGGSTMAVAPSISTNPIVPRTRTATVAAYRLYN